MASLMIALLFIEALKYTYNSLHKHLISILTRNCYNIPEIVETVHPMSDHFRSSVHLNPHAYL